jgi:hypothetical protein
VCTIDHFVARPVCATALRRLYRERAPTIPQMVLVDTSTSLIQVMLAAGLVVAGAGTL